MIQVSVPSRGLSYLNAIKKVELILFEKVSVPSRGLSYLKQEKQIYQLYLEFPSPHGDSLI